MDRENNRDNRSGEKTNREAGLRFECRPGCIKCCEIPGMVFVHKREIPRMAEYFRMKESRFIKKYLNRHWAEIYQLDFPEEEPCMFLEDDGCGIYPARPAQCRTFPFWPENINNPEKWGELKGFCPGIGVGRLYNIDEIIGLMAEVCYGPFL